MKHLIATILLCVGVPAGVTAATSTDLSEPSAPQEPPYEQIEREHGDTIRDLQSLAQEHRQRMLSQPVTRLPSVYYRPVLATREEPYAVLGRCGDERSCERMEEELKAIRTESCRTVFLLLDAQLNQGYESPESVYGSTEDVVFISRSQPNSPYKLMDKQPQPGNLGPLACR